METRNYIMDIYKVLKDTLLIENPIMKYGRSLQKYGKGNKMFSPYKMSTGETLLEKAW